LGLPEVDAGPFSGREWEVERTDEACDFGKCIDEISLCFRAAASATVVFAQARKLTALLVGEFVSTPISSGTDFRRQSTVMAHFRERTARLFSVRFVIREVLRSRRMVNSMFADD
jgi:hypothetical protein